MKLNELKYTPGSKTSKTIIGRGMASGKGKTSTRGHKGQNSRSGGGVRPGFEGGQTPLFRRLPKIGFTSPNQKEYVLINLEQLEKLGLTDVNHKTLIEKGVLRNEKQLVKILGNGTLTLKVNLIVNKISQSAKQAVEANGGKVELI
ncbi:50S ribosomal protein L15 [Williamsoniiplasma luminosum]|uniref:Large ribosomal subunit protein uL15 n=1 Tax=Williamsoniiplasma luminosum TaxID=214888 RepID=A0A2K8NWA9_9MOLU|nr:50S ribosomal protein L15 [Williamsoniiplasma luminosum]ATZ17021.1 50S ribosomal protein L15 [Williamsoniiplasma luminosum]AVP49686.1 MAG: 50S ribosomal protein L15 [Williamsoniiplasma luminosum]